MEKTQRAVVVIEGRLWTSYSGLREKEFKPPSLRGSSSSSSSSSSFIHVRKMKNE